MRIQNRNEMKVQFFLLFHFIFMFSLERGMEVWNPLRKNVLSKINKMFIASVWFSFMFVLKDIFNLFQIGIYFGLSSEDLISLDFYYFIITILFRGLLCFNDELGKTQSYPITHACTVLT